MHVVFRTGSAVYLENSGFPRLNSDTQRPCRDLVLFIEGSKDKVKGEQCLYGVELLSLCLPVTSEQVLLVPYIAVEVH